MRIFYFLILSSLFISCSPSKGAYNAQAELDAYLGSPSNIEFTPITPAEQKSNVVIFDYQINITGSKVGGIKVLDFLNSGKIKYWVHFRTTNASNENSVSLPGPILSVNSKIEMFFKVTSSRGIFYFNNENVEQFLNLYQGQYTSDLSGQSKIELSSIPADCEIEYTLNQDLVSIPFSINFHFMPDVKYRKVYFRVDTGSDLNPAYLASTDSFSFSNENQTETLIEKFVKKNTAIPDDITQLSGNFSLEKKNCNLSSKEPLILYFPLEGEQISKTDRIYASKLNLKRNTLVVLGAFADFQKTSYISSIKTKLNLDMDTDTRLKTQPADQKIKTILRHISAVPDWDGIANEYFDSFFKNHEVSFIKNVSALIWFSNVGILNPGFCLESDINGVRIQEVTTQKQCSSPNFIEFGN